MKKLNDVPKYKGAQNILVLLTRSNLISGLNVMRLRNGICYSLLITGAFLITTSSCSKHDTAPTVTDIDGNVYHTVTIGTQVWMVENLRTTRYSNGDLIGSTTTASQDLTSEVQPRYQWAYDGDESKVATYGRLYTGYIIGIANICPAGWHIPSDAEWTTLATYLGGESEAGNKLKEKGTAHWLSPNAGATNESGFSGLPGGFRNSDGAFRNIGKNGYWWTSSWERDGVNVVGQYFRPMTNLNGDVSSLIYPDEKVGFSVRCIKD
jgi:uncharacterized protein (TIGR02145 family)